MLSFDPASGNSQLQLRQSAQDLQAQVNGQALSSDQNQVAIGASGLQIAATATGSSTVSVTADPSVAVQAMQSFVSAFNAMSTRLGQGHTSATGSSAAQQALGAIQSVDAVFANAVPADSISLASTGLTQGEHGLLSLDATQAMSSLQGQAARTQAAWQHLASAIAPSGATDAPSTASAKPDLRTLVSPGTSAAPATVGLDSSGRGSWVQRNQARRLLRQYQDIESESSASLDAPSAAAGQTS